MGLDSQVFLGYFYTQSIFGLPARAPGGPGCRSTRTLETRSSLPETPSPRRFVGSRVSFSKPPGLGLSRLCPAKSPVQTASPRPRPRATSLSRLNVSERIADLVPYGPTRSIP